MSKAKRIKPEEKVNIVRKCQAGEISIRAAGQETGVDRKTICRWMARYEAEGTAGFLPQEQNRVYPPETKRQAVRDYQAGKGSLQEMCKRYKIRDKKTLRAWIKVYNARGDFNSRKYSGGGVSASDKM